MTDEEKQNMLREWLAEHQDRINQGMIEALEEMGYLSVNMVDAGVAGAEKLKQQLHAVAINSHAVLAETVRTKLTEWFSDKTALLREALGRAAEKNVRDDPNAYIVLAVDWAYRSGYFDRQRSTAAKQAGGGDTGSEMDRPRG
jgi:hypothetical protein